MGAGLVALGAAALAARTVMRRNGNASSEAFRRVAVSRQDLRIAKTATGEVTPQNRVEVKPPIAGRIEEVLVREGEAVTQGQVLVWMSSAERAALLDAARSQGPEALARWESAYKAAPLLSPLDGTVIVRAMEPGQSVATDDAVVVVADRLIIKAQVDETDIASIAVGQAATGDLDAFPDAGIPARVDHVAYEAKTVNNVTMYEVDVLPEDPPAFMRSGMTAMVTFTVAEKPGALVVPAEAVHRETADASVLVPGSQPWERPTPTRVVIGLTDGKWTEIVSGLTEGETVLAPSLGQAIRSSSNGRRNPFSPFGAGARSGAGGRRQP
jgi:macrolide-specific efflux system membrane fusion protein